MSIFSRALSLAGFGIKKSPRERSISEPEKVTTKEFLKTSKAQTTYNRSPVHKHDPLYNKRAAQACKVIRDRMGKVLE